MSTLDMQQFAHYGVATVYEAAGRAGLIDIPLFQIIPGSRVAGPARTVQCGQDDNLMVHAVLDQVQPGEVLVLINAEFISARHEFPPLNSAHEAFVIHLEEVYAFRNVVVKNQAMPERRVVLKGSIERRAKITAL